MAIYKRGKIYWYKFSWLGEAIRESTKQRNDKVARQMEAAHRTSLAKGEVGIRERRTSPTLAAFLEHRIEPWATRRTSWIWYRSGMRSLLLYKPLSNLRLNEVKGEQVGDFASHRLAQGLQAGSINSSLRVLRRVLRLAVEWGALESAPKIELLPGEHRRERVITADEESRYLAAASPLLASVATILADTGLRPDECHRLRWEDITWANGRNGTLLVTRGKTAAARRVLPLSPKGQSSARTMLGDRWEAIGGVDLACADQDGAYRPFKPQEAARKGAEGVRCSFLCALQPSTHVPDPSR